MKKKMSVIAIFSMLVLVPFMQSAFVSACTVQEVSFSGEQIQFIPAGQRFDGNIFVYTAWGHGKMVGDIAGDFRWVEHATFILGSCGSIVLGNAKVWLTITNDDGYLTIKSVMDIVYSNGQPVLSSGTWTVVRGGGIYDDVSGCGTLSDYWTFEGQIEDP